MKSYRDLEIYNESKRLAIEVHKMSMALPKFELYEEGSQVRRSSKSITSSIVEGYGRRNLSFRLPVAGCRWVDYIIKHL